MKHLLRKNQVFMCAKFKDLVSTLEYDKGGKSYVNERKLRFDHGKEVHVMETEQGPNGWSRTIEKCVSLVPEGKNPANSKFIVVSVALTGGGTGHGPHDVYPDGHYVVAKEIVGSRQVSREVGFYQTGCFIGMVDPKEIEWVSGPPDKEVKLQKAWEEAE
jgi:hypothetical protein